jgi:hypothetical protein
MTGGGRARWRRQRQRKWRARVRWLGRGVLLSALLLGACGGGDDGGGGAAATSTTADGPTTTAPKKGAPRLRAGPVAAGEHSVDLGPVGFRFAVDDGWTSRGQSSDYFELFRGPAEEGRAVLTVATPGQGSAIDHSPDVLLRRMREVATLSAPSDTTLGGLPMRRVEVSSTGDVPLFNLLSGTAVQEAGRTSTLWLGQAGSSTVVVMVDAVDAEFATFLPEAEAVLRTLRIEA